MRNAAWLSLLFSVIFVIGCCSSFRSPNSPSVDKIEYIKHLKKSTVALQEYIQSENIWHTYCSGVWISSNKFISAKHCVNPDAEDPTSNELIGRIVHFKNQFEENPDNHYPPAHSAMLPHVAVVLSVSPTTDLALFYILENIPHEYVKIGGHSLESGSFTYIVGHTSGLEWSYQDGMVSNTRMIHPSEKWVKVYQINSFSFSGNSGGGMFDANGNLMGICSLLFMRSPGTIFFIHQDEIKLFLKDQM